MDSEDDSLSIARDRVRLAYDPALLRTVGERLIGQLAGHLAAVQASTGRVLNWAAPTENIARATRIADGIEIPADPTELVSRFERIVQEMLSRGHNLHDPRYVGHQVPAPIPLAGLFDAVGSVTNQVMAVYEMGPWATAVEQAMVHKLAGYLGWQEGEYAGIVTHGGTLANLNALLVARNVALADCWEDGLGSFETLVEFESCPSPATENADVNPRSNSINIGKQAAPVLVVQEDAHYSIARAAGILGLGTRHVVKVGLDDRRRMNVTKLDESLRDLKSKGHPVIAVVACACSTPIGAFDPLNDVADVCQQHGVWLHVDAAHGGSALLSKRHRHLLDGIERADSIVWDAHKMLFVPALCAFLFFKNKHHSYEAFRQNAPYLFDPSSLGMAEYDVGLRTFECTKRAAVYGLWGVWSLLGPQIFTDLVDVTFDLGRVMYQKLQAAPDFSPLHEPQCNIVTFRHVPQALDGATADELGEFQRRIRRTIIESGEFYLVATKLGGIDALRVTLINPITTAEHIDRLLETIRRIGREFLNVE